MIAFIANYPQFLYVNRKQNKCLVNGKRKIDRKKNIALIVTSWF